MKNKTLLKFLLCFLIVGSGLSLMKVEAATGSSEEVYAEVCQSCSGRVTSGICSSGATVMKYDGKNYHITNKYICPTCFCAINEAYHSYCGSIGWMTVKIGTCVCGGDIITDGSRIRCTKGSLTEPKKVGDKYVCGAVTQCSAEGCDGYIVGGKCSTGKSVGTYNRRTYHYSSKYICRMCSPAKVVDGASCGAHPAVQALEIGRCECGGKMLAAGTDVLCSKTSTTLEKVDGKYKCKAQIEMEHQHEYEEVNVTSRRDGTHHSSFKCKTCNKYKLDANGMILVSVVPCEISAAGTYASNGNGTHTVGSGCLKCGYAAVGKSYTYNCSKDHKTVRGIDRSKDGLELYKLRDSIHMIEYKCDTCNGTWKEQEYHTWLDGRCRYCTGIASAVDNPSSGGPSAKPFFQTGALLGVDFKIATLFGWDAGNENVTPIKHILGLIMMVGTYAGVIIMAIYAIQWMTSTPARRQELKAGMIPLILGIVLLMVGPRLAILIVEALL